MRGSETEGGRYFVKELRQIQSQVPASESIERGSGTIEYEHIRADNWQLWALVTRGTRSSLTVRARGLRGECCWRSLVTWCRPCRIQTTSPAELYSSGMESTREVVRALRISWAQEGPNGEEGCGRVSIEGQRCALRRVTCNQRPQATATQAAKRCEQRGTHRQGFLQSVESNVAGCEACSYPSKGSRTSGEPAQRANPRLSQSQVHRQAVYGCPRPLQTAFLTMNLTLTLKSGVARNGHHAVEAMSPE